MSTDSLKYTGNPITKASPDVMYFCACCGRAHTKLDAMMRKFFTGYSACCAENLMPVKPGTKMSCDMCRR